MIMIDSVDDLPLGKLFYNADGKDESDYKYIGFKATDSLVIWVDIQEGKATGDSAVEGINSDTNWLPNNDNELESIIDLFIDNMNYCIDIDDLYGDRLNYYEEWLRYA